LSSPKVPATFLYSSHRSEAASKYLEILGILHRYIKKRGNACAHEFPMAL
jgi:hypothetical protein